MRVSFIFTPEEESIINMLLKGKAIGEWMFDEKHEDYITLTESHRTACRAIVVLCGPFLEYREGSKYGYWEMNEMGRTLFSNIGKQDCVFNSNTLPTKTLTEKDIIVERVISEEADYYQRNHFVTGVSNQFGKQEESTVDS